MARTVFDVIEIDDIQQQPSSVQTPKTVFDQVEDVQQEPSALKEVAQFGARGFAKGLGTPGSLLELAGLQTTRQLPGERIRTEQEAEQFDQKPSFAALLGDDDILPQGAVIPTSEQTQNIAELLGAPIGEPETISGRFGERIGEALGAAISFGGAGALPLATGAAAGQAVEEVTDSPLAGTITELVVGLGAPSLARRVVPRAAQKDLVEVGRKFGMTEAQLTPLLQNEKKLKTLAKFARKGDKTEKLITGIESTLGDSYGIVKEKAKNLPILTDSTKKTVIEDFSKVLSDLKKTVRAAPEKQQAINFLEDSIQNLRVSDVPPESLINFFQDVNQFVNWKTIKGGKKQLAALKKPILDALKKSDPEIAKDFEVLNKLYGKFKIAQKNLKPDIVDKWIDKGEVGALLLSMGTGFPGVASLVFKEAVGRRFVRELLINPRFQGMQRKLLTSIKNDKPKVAAATGKQIVRFLKDKYPDEVKENLDETIFNRL